MLSKWLPEISTTIELVQFARLNRALPYPDDSFIPRALESHRTTLTEGEQEQKVPVWLAPTIKKIVSRAMKKMTKEEIQDLRRCNFTPRLSTSATIGVSSRKGGLYGWARLEGMLDDDPYKSSQNIMRKSRGYLTYLSNLKKMGKHEDIYPMMEPVAIKEKGCKVRIATKSPPELNLVAQHPQRCLLALLKHLVPSKGTLHGNLNFSEHHWVKEHHLEEGVALSADLSKASDRIPFSIGYTVLKTAMDTFYDMEDEEETTNYNNIDAATILTGPMRFPDGTKTKRGLLMGLPTTWPILSLLNMACFEFGAQKLDRHRYSICGDDLIALCEERSSQNYQANLQECSLRINAKKHLVIPLVRGRTVGAVFTEEVFLFKTGEVKTPAGKKPEMWDFIAHKILTSTTQTHHIQTPHPGAILQCKPRGILETGSKYTTIKMCFDQLASTPGKRGRVAIELAKDLHKDIIRKLEASGIPPYWPRELGGAGLPGKQSAPPSLRKRIAALLTLQPLESSRIIRKFKRIWEPRSRSDAAEQADIDLEYTITKIPEHKTGTSSQEALSLLRPTFIGPPSSKDFP
jgi:hypothetical protein